MKWRRRWPTTTGVDSSPGLHGSLIFHAASLRQIATMFGVALRRNGCGRRHAYASAGRRRLRRQIAALIAAPSPDCGLSFLYASMGQAHQHSVRGEAHKCSIGLSSFEFGASMFDRQLLFEPRLPINQSCFEELHRNKFSGCYAEPRLPISQSCLAPAVVRLFFVNSGQ